MHGCNPPGWHRSKLVYYIIDYGRHSCRSKVSKWSTIDGVGTAWDINSHARAQTSLSTMLINNASTNILQHTGMSWQELPIKSQARLVHLLCLQWVCWSSAKCFEEPPLQIPSQLLPGHTPHFLPALLSALRYSHIVRCLPSVFPKIVSEVILCRKVS